MSVFQESSSEIRDRSMKNLDIKNFYLKLFKTILINNGLYKLPGHNK